MDRSRGGSVRTRCSLALLLALGAACGGDGGGEGPASSTTADAAAAPTTAAPTDPGAGPATDTTAAGGGAPTDPAGPATTPPGPPATLPPTVTAADICALVPAATVAAAVGVAEVAPSPGASPTPQCSYTFVTATGSATDATVAVLRPEEDLAGRRGNEAFDYVVDLNLSVAGGATTTEVAAGDRALVLTGNSLHFGVVLLGDRIATTLLHVTAGDVDRAVALTQAAAAALTGG